MRVMVDLNVVLDVLLDRTPHSEPAAQLWALVESGAVEGLLAAHGVTTLFYLAQRARGRAFAERCVEDVLSVFGVATVDEAVLRAALSLRFADFEDAVVSAAAVASGATLIVSRDLRGFANASLPVLTPAAAAVAVLGP